MITIDVITIDVITIDVITINVITVFYVRITDNNIIRDPIKRCELMNTSDSQSHETAFSKKRRFFLNPNFRFSSIIRLEFDRSKSKFNSYSFQSRILTTISKL